MLNFVSIFSLHYQITYTDEGFKPLFEKITKEKNIINQIYDSTNNALTFFPSSDESFSVATHYCIDSTKNQAFLEAIALKTVDQFLPEFKGKIEFDRTDVTRQNGMYILSIEVFFHRLFKNRIVFPATSFISVALNGKGDVTSIKVKWPKFRYATTCSPFAFGK